MPGVRRWAVSWLPVIAWAVLIFAFSSRSDLRFLPDDVLDFVLRKVGHAGVFGILALLLWFAMAKTTSRQRPWAWALVLAWAYAATDELHQGFVAGRHAAITDVAIDASGALLAVAGVACLRVLLRHNRSSS